MVNYKYKLTKIKDTRFNGEHPNGVYEGSEKYGDRISELEIGKPFVIFDSIGRRFRQTSNVTKIISETEFETENSIYKIEKL